MDIWDWVRGVHAELRASGHHRLSQLVRALPGAVCDNEHARVDAIVPEALALARSVEHPWLELFVRHWNLQSRILHRHQIEDWMGEAVSLIEFANRPETRDCPQSVCVTQDLVNCYANRDGPGFAAERIAASRETLGRIDATWPCYCCIGGELVDALVDAGRAEEALAELDHMEAELARTDEWEADPMGDSRAAVLRELGRHEQALALIERLLDDPEDEDSRLARQIERARILAEMGRDDDALDAVPRFDAIAGTHSLYRGWAEAVFALVKRGAVPNTWHREARMRAIAAELRANGVVRHALEVTVMRVTMAIARGRTSTARRALAEARDLLPRLHAPLDAAPRLDALAAAVDALDGVRGVTIEDAEAALAGLGDDPEGDLEALATAAARWPDDPRLAVAAAEAWRALGELARAEAALEPHRGAAVADTELGHLCAARGDWAGLAEVAARLAAADDPDLARQGRDFGIRAARRGGDLATELALLAADARARPDDPHGAMRLADAQAETDPAAALATLDALIARDPPPGPWDWRRILVATRLDGWEAVRHSGARLGLSFESEAGPIDEAWGLVRVRIGEVETWAERTGPVTARVIGIDDPDSPCHYHDVVVFDPLPLDEGDGEGSVQTFECVAARSQGGYRAFVIDARHPGDDAVEALAEAVDDLGGELRDVTGDRYRVVDPETEAAHPGLYARVAIPADALGALDRLLARLCADWPGPVGWVELLDALGEEDRADAQRAEMLRWGM